MKSVSVFCGANQGNDQIYRQKAIELANELSSQSLELVFGGGRVGLMGVIADQMLKNGSNVTGVIPAFLSHKEIEHPSCTHMIRVESMHQRKMKMFELSQGIIAMPGGFGTLDELFEILTWAQLGLHSYPIALYNVNSYFDKLIEFIDKSIEEGFVKGEYRSLIIAESDPSVLVAKMKAYKPIEIKKWIDISKS